MSENSIGTVVWTDLTIPQAEAVKQFYEDVLGWRAEPVSMGDYDDYNLFPPDSEAPVAGICHAKGVNDQMPPQWINYVVVEDIEKSTESCLSSGGKITVPIKKMGNTGRYCVIQDPAGAFLGLYQMVNSA